MTDLKIVEGGWYQAECGAVFGPMEFERREINQYWTANGITFGLTRLSPVLIRRVNPPTDWVGPCRFCIASKFPCDSCFAKSKLACEQPVVAENATTQDRPITRRDLFAAAALAGIMANSKTSYSDLVKWNVDEYLAALDKEGGK